MLVKNIFVRFPQGCGFVKGLRQGNRGRRRIPRQLDNFTVNWKARFVTFVPVVAIAFLIWESWTAPFSPLRLVGLLILTPSLLLVTVARFQLGNPFSLAPEARELVSHGLYSSLTIAGLAPYINSSLLLLILLAVIPLQIVRARAEARVLEEKFGDTYRVYWARTWF